MAIIMMRFMIVDHISDSPPLTSDIAKLFMTLIRLMITMPMTPSINYNDHDDDINVNDIDDNDDKLTTAVILLR